MGKRYLTVEEQRDLHRCNLENMETNLGRGVPVTFLPSAMRAGPCEAAKLAAGMTLDSTTRHLPPFDDCSHPDQCACMFVIDEKRQFE